MRTTLVGSLFFDFNASLTEMDVSPKAMVPAELLPKPAVLLPPKVKLPDRNDVDIELPVFKRPFLLPMPDEAAVPTAKLTILPFVLPF